MRTNVPVDSSFGVLNVPKTEVADTGKERQVASIARSKQWKIVKEELITRIANRKAQMYNAEYPALSMEEIGKRFMANKEVIKELDSIINLVETTVNALAVQPKRP